MADVRWIKITTDIFDDEKILLIESMPSADSVIVIWFKLLTLAGKQNNDGVFLLSSKIAYTDEMLATIFRRDVNTVRMALSVFEQFGMVEIVDNVITIPNWNKHQSLDAYEKKKAYDRKYRMEQREKQKQLALMSNDCQTSGRTTVVAAEGDKEGELEGELDIRVREQEAAPLQQIADLYNSICKSFPAIRSLSDARKKAIKARLNTYSVEDFKTMFSKAEASSFLKGTNDRNWIATFDWLIKDNNMAKVLDGNYDDRKKTGGRKEIVPTWMLSDDKAKRAVDENRRLLERMRNAGNDAEIASRAEELKRKLSNT